MNFASWIYMDIHGYTWIYMDIYTWIYMDIHGYTWIYMDIHGYTWIPLSILSRFAVSSSGLLLASPVEPPGFEVCRVFWKNGQLRFVALGLLPGYGLHAPGLRGSGLSWIICTTDTQPGVKCSAARSTRHGGQRHGPGCFALRKRPDAWPCAVGLWTAHLCWCGRCGDPCASAASSWLWLTLADSNWL